MDFEGIFVEIREAILSIERMKKGSFSLSDENPGAQFLRPRGASQSWDDEHRRTLALFRSSNRVSLSPCGRILRPTKRRARRGTADDS